MALSVTFVGRGGFISTDVAPRGFPRGEKIDLGEMGGGEPQGEEAAWEARLAKHQNAQIPQ